MTTWDKQCEHNLLTACDEFLEQHCYKSAAVCYNLCVFTCVLLSCAFEIRYTYLFFFLRTLIAVTISKIARINGSIMSHHKSLLFLASVDPGLNVISRGVGVLVTSQHVLLVSVFLPGDRSISVRSFAPSDVAVKSTEGPDNLFSVERMYGFISVRSFISSDVAVKSTEVPDTLFSVERMYGVISVRSFISSDVAVKSTEVPDTLFSVKRMYGVISVRSFISSDVAVKSTEVPDTLFSVKRMYGVISVRSSISSDVTVKFTEVPDNLFSVKRMYGVISVRSFISSDVTVKFTEVPDNLFSVTSVKRLYGENGFSSTK